MTKKLEDALYKKYPKMLAGFKKSPHESCLAFGCAHGDGWYTIIDALLCCIYFHTQEVVVEQIKEKFGGLRFYYTSPRENDGRVDGMVILAENLSYKTCEQCGSTNNVTQTKGAWIKSLCSKCMVTT